MTKERSRVYGVRVSEELAAAIDAAAGPQPAEWFRKVLAAAVGQSPHTKSDAVMEGFEEGKRQGWAHANAVFREALGVAAKKLKGE